MEKWKVKDCKNRGKFERVEYTSLSPEGEKIDKYANVYLPYGYTPDKKYDVLYLIHGGGGNPDAWFDHAPTKNILDHMINDGTIKPMIVVTPGFYSAEQVGFNPEWLKDQTYLFQRELAEDLIPCVEGKYSTYAEDTTPEGIKASRMHRGISGFSMGGVTTWFAVMHNLDKIAWFAPLSGDCWAVEPQGGRSKPEETAEILHDAVAGCEDYMIYAITGTKDIAYPQLSVQCETMSKMTDTFSEKNFKFHFEEDYVHAYEDVCNYLRIALPEFFK